MSRCGSGKSMLVNSILGDDIVTQGDHHYSISYSLADTNLILKELDPQNIEIFKQVCLDEKNIIIYVISVTELGSNDENIILIANEMKRSGKQCKDRFIFAISKCDELDFQGSESISKMLKYATEYLSGFGIKEPKLFPISAQTAKVIRRKQRGVKLTRQEKKDLDLYEDFIEVSGFHLEKMASLSEDSRIRIEYKLNEARKENDAYEEALIHTGVPSIEQYIDEYIKNNLNYKEKRKIHDKYLYKI